MNELNPKKEELRQNLARQMKLFQQKGGQITKLAPTKWADPKKSFNNKTNEDNTPEIQDNSTPETQDNNTPEHSENMPS